MKGKNYQTVGTVPKFNRQSVATEAATIPPVTEATTIPPVTYIFMTN
jgi:hypothetical protein